MTRIQRLLTTAVATVALLAATLVAVGPAQASTAPTIASVTASTTSSGTIVVDWNAPTSAVSGATLVGYRVTTFLSGVSVGSTSVGTTPTDLSVGSLNNGSAYTVRVGAVYSNGTVVESSMSSSATPYGRPGTPTSLVATPSDGQILLTWAAAAENGSAVTAYTITASNVATITLGGGVSSHTVTGLTNGTTYTFSITATNARGNSAVAGSFGSAVPVGAPTAPTSVEASAGNSSAVVTWTAPANTGGSAVDYYTVTPTPQTVSPLTVSVTSGLAASFTGLTNGTGYTFAVTATNESGQTSAAGSSTSVTPTAGLTPTVVSVALPYLATAGGDEVVALGTNFASVDDFASGGNGLYLDCNGNGIADNSEEVTISAETPTRVTGTAPACSSTGTKSVIIVMPAGSATLTGGVTYSAVPVVTSLNPASGPTTGNTSVTINGSGFVASTAETVVKIGTVTAAITSRTSTSIVISTPAGTAGAKDVSVMIGQRTSLTGVLPGGFTYTAVDTGSTPGGGSTGGGSTGGGSTGGGSTGGGTTPTTPTGPTPGAVVPPASGTTPSLVTTGNQRTLEAAAGSAGGRVNGVAVTAAITRAPSEASAAAVRQHATQLLDRLNTAAAGAPVAVTTQQTNDGATVRGLAVNPTRPSQAVAIPAQDVVLVQVGDAAVMMAAVGPDGRPARVAADGVLELPSGGALATVTYGFTPNAAGEIVVLSTPRLLGRFTTTANGAFAGQVDLPADLPAGDHTIVIATATRSTSLGVRVAGNGGFAPVRPSRVADTRVGAKPAAGSTVTVDVVGGSVPATATAVAVNVTATRTTGPGFVTVWACGSAKPETSTLNITSGDVANAAVVAVGTGDSICLSPSVATDLIVDVTGYFSADITSRFTAVTARRMLDTRTTTRPRAGSTTQAVISNVPTGATSVAVNVTAVNAVAAGYVTAWACGTTRPEASSLNFAAGDTVAGSVMVGLGSGQRLCLFTSASADLLVDVAGWFGPTGTSDLEIVAPQRAFDSRASSALVPGVVRRVDVSDIAAGATTVVVNLTGVGPSTDGYLTAYNCSATVPEVSNLNLRAGGTRANQAIVALSATGDICLVGSAVTHAIVDVVARYR